MTIINKSKTVIFNFDDISEISLNRNNEGKIYYQRKGSDKLYILETYDSSEEARAAMQALCKAMGSYNSFCMPTEKELQAQLCSSHDSISRAANGKKTVRRGGS